MIALCSLRFEIEYGARLSGSIIAVEDEKRYHAPIAVEEAYPLDENDADDIEHKNHVVHFLLALNFLRTAQQIHN